MDTDTVTKTEEAETETKTEAESHEAVGARGLETTPEPPEPPTPEQRRAACELAINAVLRQHGCQLVPYLTEEYVGELHQKKLTTAMCGVVPNQ